MSQILRWILRPKRSATEDLPGTVSMLPLLRMAGVKHIEIHWPSLEDRLVMGALLHQQADEEGVISGKRLLATALEVLGDIPAPMARRMALAYPREVEVLIMTAFQDLRSQFLPGDPYLDERLPAILAGEAR